MCAQFAFPLTNTLSSNFPPPPPLPHKHMHLVVISVYCTGAAGGRWEYENLQGYIGAFIIDPPLITFSPMEPAREDEEGWLLP